MSVEDQPSRDQSSIFYINNTVTESRSWKNNDSFDSCWLKTKENKLVWLNCWAASCTIYRGTTTALCREQVSRFISENVAFFEAFNSSCGKSTSPQWQLSRQLRFEVQLPARRRSPTLSWWPLCAGGRLPGWTPDCESPRRLCCCSACTLTPFHLRRHTT